MTSASIENVMVLAASGSLGPLIVDTLLASGFLFFALTRESSEATSTEGVYVVRTDYSPESFGKALEGQDALVSTIATLSTQEQIEFINAAIAAKVMSFLLSESGVDKSISMMPFNTSSSRRAPAYPGLL